MTRVGVRGTGMGTVTGIQSRSQPPRSQSNGRTDGRLLLDSDGRVLLVVAPEIEFDFEFGSVSDFAILRVALWLFALVG